MKTNWKKTSVIKEATHNASGTSDMRDAKEPSPAFEGGAAAQQAQAAIPEPEQNVDPGVDVTADQLSTSLETYAEPISDIVTAFVEQDSQAEEEFVSGEDKGIPETLAKVSFMDEVINTINKIAEETVDRGGFEIGEFVLDHIFQNDLKLAQSKNPRKSASFAMLSDHPGLRVHPARISQWVRSVAFYKKMLEEGVDLSNLRISHLVELLPLEDEDKRRELAEEANANGYSVRQVRDKVTGLKQIGAQVDKGQMILRKIAHSLSLLGDEELMRFLSDKETLQQELTSADRLRILSDLDRNKKAFDNFRYLIEQLETDLFEIEREKRG